MQARPLRLISAMLFAALLVACSSKEQRKPAAPGRGHSTHPQGKKHDTPHDGHARKHDGGAKRGHAGPSDAGPVEPAPAPSAPREPAPAEPGKEIFAP